MAPIVLFVTLGLALAVAATLVASNHRDAGRRVLVVGALGPAIAAIALLPDLIRLLGSPRPLSALLGGVAPLSADLTLQDLVRFSAGPMKGGMLLGAISFAALLVLVLGRGWRLRWGFAGWVITLSTWTVIVVASRVWPDAALPALSLLMVPALVGVALSFGMGTEAIVTDVVGGVFGWRQLVGVVGGLAIAAGTLPLLLASVGGRWDSFETDHADALATLQPDNPSQVRALWFGEPEDLPMRSRALTDGVGWALTDGVLPTQEAGTDVGNGKGEDGLQSTLETALDTGSGRLGAELANYGIGFVVVAEGPVPESTVEPTPDVAEVEDMLAAQLDLDELDVAPGLEGLCQPRRADRSQRAPGRLRRGPGRDRSGARRGRRARALRRRHPARRRGERGAQWRSRLAPRHRRSGHRTGRVGRRPSSSTPPSRADRACSISAAASCIGCCCSSRSGS